MKVAVYSGSFNPLHVGHKAIVGYLLEKMDFDAVYLVVSPKNPLKTTIDESSGPARYEAARRAVMNYGDPRLKVDDIELYMPAPQYTVNTLDRLSEREPGNVFVFVMGADNLGRIRFWRDYKRILEVYGVVVYPRKGFDAYAIRKDLMEENPDYKIMITDAPMVDVSSTELRNAMEAGIDVTPYLM